LPERGEMATAPPDWVICLHCPGDLGPEEIPAHLHRWCRVQESLTLYAPSHTLDACRSALAAFGPAYTATLQTEPANSTTAGAALFAVTSCAARHPGRNVAYARLDTELPDDWVHRLRNALLRAPDAGVVSPLSDEHPLLDPFAGKRPHWLRACAVDRWLGTLSHAHLFDAPIVSGRCALFRGDALHACDPQLLVQPEQLILELNSRGWAVLACDWLHADMAPQRALAVQALAIGSSADQHHYAIANPLGRMRHAFGEAAARGEPALPDTTPMLRPVQLHITHSWGGGLGKWVQDMCEADSARHNLVLRSIGTWGCFGQRIVLYAGPEMASPLREWPLDLPIRSVAQAHHQYRQILAEIIRDFDVKVLLISSLIGHALDALDTVLPTLVCAHDYFPFCPALVIRFDGVCTQCDISRLASCFSTNPLNRFFKDTDERDWQAVRHRYIVLMQRPGIRLAAPSASVIDHLRMLVPELAHLPASVVENGMDLPPPPRFEPGGRLTLVVLGSLAPHKGADLLFEALEALTAYADLHLIGCGEEGSRFHGLSGVTCVPAYRHTELPELLGRIQPHAGLLLSIVPETFSYTLSELWAFGIPPIATRLGAFADRIQQGRNGWLIDPTPTALLETLRTLDADRHALAHVRSVISQMHVTTRRDMVNAYHQLAPLDAACGKAGPAPGTLPDGREHIGALHIDRQVPLRLVLIDFVRYLRDKSASTPRLGRLTRTALDALLSFVARHLLKRHK